MPKQAARQPREIQSVQRAMAIMDCFGARSAVLTLSDLSEMTGLNKSTVYGIVYTLCRHGYMDRAVKSGQYQLGAQLARKGLLAASAQGGNLRLASLPYLRRLMAAYGVTCYLFSCEGGALCCLEMLVPPGNTYGAVSGVLGKNMAYHAAASGKVALAHMVDAELRLHMRQAPFFAFTRRTLTSAEDVLRDVQRTKSEGCAFEDEEIDDGLSALSVPIYGAQSRLTGTISASGPTALIHTVRGDIVRDMKNYSREISGRLSGLET